MARTAGRLTCPRCGANNFDTVTACWKCSAPLTAGGAAPVAAAPYAVPETRVSMPSPMMAPTAAYPVSSGDSGVARRAAIALALTLPWLGLPVGWVFMMIEDSRKQAIGRVCVIWSMIALVFHLLLMFVAMQSVGTLLLKSMDILKTMQQSQGAGGGDMGGGMGGNGLGGGRFGGGTGMP
jgi:hypothetical protein